MSQNAHSQFLGYLHSFRGLAIIQIVLIHSIVAAFLGANGFELDFTHPLVIANEVLFHDSTLYFAIISGLLYTAILKSRGYRKFYRSKFKNVFLPYVFFTLIFGVLDNEAGTGVFHESFLSYIKAIPRYLLYGKAVGPYWYMPVLFFLFLMTPILDAILDNEKFGKPIFIVLMIIPLVSTRVQMAFDYILSLQTMIYFMGAYAFGMYLGRDLSSKLDKLKSNAAVLWIITISCSIGLVYLFIADIQMIGFVDLRETLYYAQKLAMGVLFILWLRDLGESAPRWLSNVAESAFSIYFTHTFFVFMLMGAGFYAPILDLNAIAPINVILGALSMLVMSIVGSLFIVRAFRKLFGRYSRMIVGS